MASMKTEFILLSSNFSQSVRQKTDKVSDKEKIFVPSPISVYTF